MTHRMFPLFLLAIALALLVAAPAVAADDKTSHEGTFVKASGDKEFVMADKDGKEHTHTLAADAKVIGLDGKEAKLADFKKGQKIRVSTMKDDKKIAVKVEALKE